MEPRELLAADLASLADAAAAAVARADLTGQTPDVVAARAAAVQLARPDLRAHAVARALGIARAHCSGLRPGRSGPGGP